MRVIDKRQKFSRRDILKTAGGTAKLGVVVAVSGGLVTGANKAWAYEPKALTPNSMATLVQMARDIYPHDQLADRYYAKVIAEFDTKSVDDSDMKTSLEKGVSDLDAAAKAAGYGSYIETSWEKDRVNLLQAIETSSFFQSVRGSLITGIYNNPEVWPLFGYEGESFSKGGYLERGFDDVDWL